jgi:hypothetical protein
MAEKAVGVLVDSIGIRRCEENHFATLLRTKSQTHGRQSQIPFQDRGPRPTFCMQIPNWDSTTIP